MAARARATGPLTGSGPKKGSASAETRGVAVLVKRKHTSRAQKNPPRPAGKHDASLSSYQPAPHRAPASTPRPTSPGGRDKKAAWRVLYYRDFQETSLSRCHLPVTLACSRSL